jgi:transposase
MSPAYISAVMENLPKAAIVFDHFHVVKYFNDKLSEFRRALYNQMDNIFEKRILKGTRWLLLKNTLSSGFEQPKHRKSPCCKSFQIP